jgi:hypothetical protein
MKECRDNFFKIMVILAKVSDDRNCPKIVCLSEMRVAAWFQILDQQANLYIRKKCNIYNFN